MKKFFFTREFKKLSEKLPQSIKKKLKRQLSLLAENPRHPSLGSKKMGGKDNVWEARVDKQYRITFQISNDIITLKAIGTHEIYRNP